MAGSRSPASGFSEEDQKKIIWILTNPKTMYGTRAGYLLRMFPNLAFSPRAKLLYVLIAGFIGADRKTDGAISVSMKKLATWINATPRTAQSAIRELTRSGPVPLLVEVPGRPGRVGKYGWVNNPFALLEAQAKDAERVRQARDGRLRDERNEAFKALHSSKTIDEDTFAAKLAAAERRAAWNLPTR